MCQGACWERRAPWAEWLSLSDRGPVCELSRLTDASYLPSTLPRDGTESLQRKVGSFWSLWTDEEGQAQRCRGTCQRSQLASAAARPGLGDDGSKAPLTGKLLSVPAQDHGIHPPTPNALSPPASQLPLQTSPGATRKHQRSHRRSGAASWLGSKCERASPAGNPLVSRRTLKPTWGPESHPGEGHISEEVQWGWDNFRFFSPDKGQAMGPYPGWGRGTEISPASPHSGTSYCHAGIENRAAGTCFHLRECMLGVGVGGCTHTLPKGGVGERSTLSGKRGGRAGWRWGEDSALTSRFHKPPGVKTKHRRAHCPTPGPYGKGKKQ